MFNFVHVDFSLTPSLKCGQRIDPFLLCVEIHFFIWVDKVGTDQSLGHLIIEGLILCQWSTALKLQVRVKQVLSLENMDKYGFSFPFFFGGFKTKFSHIYMN